MGNFNLSFLVVITALIGTTHGETIVLRNEHLAASFETAAGPQLTEVRHGRTGAAFGFHDSQEVSLFVVPADAIHNPKLQVEFAGQKDFAFDGINVNKDRTEARIRFQHDLVQVDLQYELDPHRPVLRKTMTCTAKGKSALAAPPGRPRLQRATT